MNTFMTWSYLTRWQKYPVICQWRFSCPVNEYQIRVLFWAYCNIGWACRLFKTTNSIVCVEEAILKKYNYQPTTKCVFFWDLVSNWITNHLDTTFNYTICKIIFAIPIKHNPAITAINMLILLGKWYSNNVRTSNKNINFQAFLKLVKQKIDKIIFIKTMNNAHSNSWEINLLIAL